MTEDPKILCKIAQADCKHDFGENARSDYFNIDRGCEEYNVSESGVTSNIENYYNQYYVYKNGDRQSFSQLIPSTPPIAYLNTLPTIPIVCDFTIGPFIDDLRLLRDKVTWIKNSETMFDGASKNNYGFTEKIVNIPTHYQKSNTFNPFIPVHTQSTHFYLSKYSGAKMFSMSGKTFVVFNKENKLYVVDREYCKNNSVVNKIINGPNKTINAVMKEIKGILNGSLQKQGNTFLKYISKRLGDQGQAISALRMYDSHRSIFVTHDTLARDFAIVIEVPYIIFTYSTSTGLKGYDLFVHKRTVDPIQQAEMARKREEETNRIEEERRTNLEIIQSIITQAVNTINTELTRPISDESSIRNVFKNIIDHVYSLEIYNNKLQGDLSGLNVDSLKLVTFPTTKQKFDNFRVSWSSSFTSNGINITGIKNTYLCPNELIKISKILKNADVRLSELYNTFIDNIIRVVNNTSVSGRAAEVYKSSAIKVFSDIKSGIYVGGQGRPPGDEPVRISAKKRHVPSSEKLIEMRRVRAAEKATVKRDDAARVRRKVADFEESFLEIDEDIHAFVYLVTELVNMFRDNIDVSKLSESYNVIREHILDVISSEIEDGVSMETDDDVAEEYNFTLPFENNTFVAEYLQKFIDFEKITNTGVEKLDLTETIVNTIHTLYAKIYNSIPFWKETYNEFKTPSVSPQPAPYKISPLSTGIRAGEPIEVEGGNKYTRKRRIRVNIRRNYAGTSKTRIKHLKHTRRN